MKYPTFISLHNSFDEAMYYKNSPQMNVYSFKGIQLLNNHPYPYIQRTYANDGIELENPDSVLLYDICGEFLDDISVYFSVVEVFQDPDTGLNQIYWQLLSVPVDYGDRLVYLRIQQGANVFFYSSPFVLSSENSGYVSRWDYRNKPNEIMLSTSLRVWYKQDLRFKELTTYDQLDGRRVGMQSKSIKYEAWQTDIIDIDILNKFDDMLMLNTYVYCDLQKTVPFDAFETPKLVGRENFVQTEVMLSRDEANTYNPLYIPPTPIPVPPITEIVLTAVQSINNNQVQYSFTFANFTPTYLTLQYSLDQINWVNNTGGIVSPRINNVPNHLSNNYYYRIIHEGTGTVSNVLQLPQVTITIDNMVTSDSFNPNGNKYRIFYTASGFTPMVQFSFESSLDGLTWTPMFAGTSLPVIPGIQYATTQPSAEEFNYFRMSYSNPPISVVSPPYFNEIP